MIEAFARDVESFYDDATRKQGYIDGTDRQGHCLRFPLMTVSAVVIHLPAGRAPCSVDEVGHQIALLKKQAKQSPNRLAIGSLG